MGQDVARSQPVDDLGVTRRRATDVAHDRQPEFGRRLLGLVQRLQPQVAGDGTAQAHLDADDRVRVRAGDLHAARHVQQREVRRLADHHVAVEREDARERDVQEGQHPGTGRLDHEGMETRIGARPRAARIHHGGDLGAQRHPVRVDAVRGGPGIDMGVQVDQARHHEQAIGIVDRHARRARQHGRQRGDPAVANADVAHRIDGVGRIDDATARDDGIETGVVDHHGRLLPS